MRFLKVFSLSLVLALAGGFLLAHTVSAQDQDLANALAEYETDEVTAKSLGIEDPTVLPGESGYWWQKVKENVGLFFTFDEEKKVTKLEEIASRRLLEAQKLAATGTDNAATRVEDALERYKEKMDELADKLKTNPNIRERVLENFDANQLRHQQVLSEVAEKLRNKAPEDKIEQIEQIKKENAINWYNTQKENIEERLESAISNNEVGSKFKNLKNIATLEELSETLPEAAKEKIEAVKLQAEERLGEKLENMDPGDGEKLEKYISNIKTPEIVKQKFISNLKESEALPTAAKERVKNAFESYTTQLRNRFENLSDGEKEKFLDQFENKLRSHPANLEFLQNLDAPKFRERIQNLIEVQQEGLQEKIRATTDPAKLRSLENNLRAYPVLRREAQEQQRKALQAPSIRPMQAQPTANDQ